MFNLEIGCMRLPPPNRPATASEGSEERRSRSGTDRMSDLANTANITIDDFDIVKVSIPLKEKGWGWCLMC